VALMMVSIEAGARKLPLCSPDFLSGGQCDLDSAIHDFPDGKTMGAAYESNKPEHESARKYFATPPSKIELERAQTLFQEAKELVIALIDNGQKMEKLDRAERYLVRKLKALKPLEVKSAADPLCAENGLEKADAYFNAIEGKVLVCPAVLKFPSVTIVWILGHEIAHAVDDCNGTSPTYKFPSGGLVSIKSKEILQAALPKFAKQMKMSENPADPYWIREYKFESLRQCLVAEKGMRVPVLGGGHFPKTCGQYSAGEDIADLIGFKITYDYVMKNKLPKTDIKYAFAHVLPFACKTKTDPWFRNPISNDLTRMNIGFGTPGIADALGCKGTVGRTYSCHLEDALKSRGPASKKSEAPIQ
jgi:hypothetical protein